MKYTAHNIESVIKDYHIFARNLVHIAQVMYDKKYPFMYNFDMDDITWLSVDKKKNTVYVCLYTTTENYRYSFDEYIPIEYFALTDEELEAKRQEIEAAEKAAKEEHDRKVAEARSAAAKKAAATRAKNKRAKELKQLAKLQAKYAKKAKEPYIKET